MAYTLRMKLQENSASYPVTLTTDVGNVLVTLRMSPKAITFGVDEAEAMIHALVALETTPSLYAEAGLPLPLPSASKPKPGQKSVRPGAPP